MAFVYLIIGFLVGFVVGFSTTVMMVRKLNSHGTKKQHKLRDKIKNIGVMNFILILIGVALLTFTVIMIWLFTQYNSIPDTLVTCVFAALTGECSIMGWIRVAKEKKAEIEANKRMEGHLDDTSGN